MNTAVINFFKFLLFLSVGLVILYLVYQNQNTAYLAQCATDGIPAADCSLIQKVIEDFKGLNYFWVLGVFVAYTFSNMMRALRWNMLLKSLGRTPRTINSFLTIMLALFANLGLPRLGEVLRPVTLARYEKMPVEKVLGTIVVDRTLDVLSLLILIGIAFLLEFDRLWGYLSENMVNNGEGGLLSNPIILGLGGFGVLSLILLFVFRNKIQQSALFKKFVNLLKGFWDGIMSIRNLENPPLFIFYSIMIWVAYYLMFYMYLPAFSPTAHLGFTVALMIFVFGTFGIVIPSPGGMGSYHFLVMAALALYGVTGSDAFSFANFSFFATHICNIVLGLVAVIFLPTINKNYHPVPIE